MANKNFAVKNGLDVAGDATLTGDLQINGLDIKNNQGLTNITLGSSLTQPSITVGTIALNTISGVITTTSGNLELRPAVGTYVLTSNQTMIGSTSVAPIASVPFSTYGLTLGPEFIRGSTAAATNNAATLVKNKNTTARAVNDGLALDTIFRNTTSDVAASRISTVCTDATAASEDYDFVFLLMQNGAARAEKFRVASTGDATFAGDIRVNGNDIQCSSGASTITMTSANTATTIRGNTIYLQDSASAAICGSFVSYSRQYGDFANLNTIVPAAANTAYAFALPTTNNANGISIASTSHIVCSNPGNYNLQFSVQWENTDNGNDHNLYIWLRRNGVDVANTGSRITCVKNSSGIAAWNYIAAAAAANDYFELMYSVDDTAIQMPYIAASSPVPAIPSVILTMVPVGI